MGELQKRINHAKFGISHLDYVTEHAVAKAPLLNWVEEMTKEFPSRRAFLESMKYIELSFEDGEIKDFLKRTLKETKDTIKKWLTK